MPHTLPRIIAQVREQNRPTRLGAILLAELDRAIAAIQAHHDTKYGSARPAAVISPPDQALYAATGIKHRTLDGETLDAIRRAPAREPVGG